MERAMSIEEEYVALKESPFTKESLNTSSPAIALDWSDKQSCFNVTLLALSRDENEERLWSDNFTIRKIQRRHCELCLVHPEIKNMLPQLPREPQGVWGYIQWTKVRTEDCKNLEEYFKNAFIYCGWKLFSSVFFGEPIIFDEDYTISTMELKRNKVLKEVQYCSGIFQNHLVEKEEMKNVDALFAWYEKLWCHLNESSEAERKLLTFDIEPYEELRDITQRQRSECASMLNQQSMTASMMQNNNETFSELEEQFVETVKSINEMTIAQLNTSVARLKLILTQLQKDREKFTEDDEKLMIVEMKLFELEKTILTEDIEILNCQSQLSLFERDKIRRDVLVMDEDLSMVKKVNEKELQVYKKQLEILDALLNIQDKSEKLARLNLNRKIRGTMVKEDEMKTVSALQKTIVNTGRKKSVLRTKQKLCMTEIKKLESKDEEERELYESHHKIRMKIERRREEDEPKIGVRLEERQRTLLRLKEYKKKYPVKREVKPPRYQSRSMRKQEQKENRKTKDPKTSNATKENARNTRTPTNISQQPTTSQQTSSSAIPSPPSSSPQSVPLSPPPVAPPSPPVAPPHQLYHPTSCTTPPVAPPHQLHPTTPTTTTCTPTSPKCTRIDKERKRSNTSSCIFEPTYIRYE
ncbi:junction-mediating and -regulatory protein-like [Xenia sp. Carnegie-2017]|uniref:junction-mediating and -regulatory protein-like n=1 Tax=Xenia sp. Carnegie-2017 TaxID=2897299 RepID=UPI001F04D798|nr:junction-mediating and -regulatory protein-like [Xenia sp. Carnegie-2017]XP_046864232.1 junction-mediating and -regulatory protein-like [Xenia sp. Carnegie-2017]